MAATGETLNVLESCRISPPSTTTYGEKSLQLTLFDLLWLQLPPVHQLFFYEFNHSKTHFINTIIPTLKHSLSITLQHFFPFTSHLIIFPNQIQSNHVKKPEIHHVDSDSVNVTFAESDLDFNVLTGNHPRNCEKFYPLVPLLGCLTNESENLKIPLCSIQVTYFLNLGISIGITNHHVLCDARSKYEFLKAWTSIARSGSDETFLASESMPFYDRVIKLPNNIEDKILRHMGIDNLYENYQIPHLVGPTDKVRATFILTQADIVRLKKLVSTERPKLEYISSFLVTCGYIWSCLAKARAECEETKGENELEQFICSADLRARLDPPIPLTYFGNCVTLCLATAKSIVLSGKEGLFTAVEIIGEAISKSVKSAGQMSKEDEKAIENGDYDVEVSVKTGVAGTPKLNVYDVDFGWGKPIKYETVSIDYTGAISINASKGSLEDLEIGLSLNVKQMDVFATIFRKGLENNIS